MIQSIIIDDEPDGRDILYMLLQKYCPDVQVAAQVSSVKEAFQVLNDHPDVKLVFLDVDMGNSTGFDVLNGMKDRFFEVIFVTAHDKYAIKAIKFGATDYILKPIDFNELVTAVERVRKKLSETVAGTATENGKLKVQLKDKVIYIDTDEIMWLCAAGNYTEIHTVNKQRYMVAKTLGEYEEKLGALSGQFVRINRNAIVHLKAIKSLEKGVDACIELKDHTILPVSRRRRSEVMDKMKGM